MRKRTAWRVRVDNGDDLLALAETPAQAVELADEELRARQMRAGGAGEGLRSGASFRVTKFELEVVEQDAYPVASQFIPPTIEGAA